MDAIGPVLRLPVGLSLSILIVLVGLIPDSAHADSPFTLVGRAGGATQTVAVQGDIAFMARGNVMTLVDVFECDSDPQSGTVVSITKFLQPGKGES